MQNLNRVVLTGNLTRDPELKNTSSDLKVCRMRVACNGRVKRGGEWQDKANYFDVTCFGSQAENCARYLSKGRQIAIDGRLDWQEWEKDGQKRQAVQIIAETVQFISDGSDDGNRGGSSQAATQGEPAAPPVTAPPEDDDIPF